MDLKKNENVVEIEHVEESDAAEKPGFAGNEDENEEVGDDEVGDDDADEEEAGDEPVEEIEDDEEEAFEDSKITDTITFEPPRIRRKNAINALKSLLENFARFSSPKTVKREPELKAIYNELLKCDQLVLRQTAFNCILAYRYSFLTPYSEYFSHLLDLKKFREGLVLFGISDENSVIQSGHREEVMPYLLKILYGTLSSYVAVRAVARRNAVLNYVGGCQPQELQQFFGIMFETLLEKLAIDADISQQTIEQLCGNIVAAYSPSNTLSPKKLKRLVEYFNY